MLNVCKRNDLYRRGSHIYMRESYDAKFQVQRERKGVSLVSCFGYPWIFWTVGFLLELCVPILSILEGLSLF